MEQPNVEPDLQTADADGVAVATGGSPAVATRDESRNRRRVKQGVVRSDKMDKTIVVVTETRVPHPTYKKIVRKSVRFKAHDEKNEAKTGDTVRIMEMRPMSRDKRWRLLEIVERAR
jgi:small subunit ribosomal protein S17